MDLKPRVAGQPRSESVGPWALDPLPSPKGSSAPPLPALPASLTSPDFGWRLQLVRAAAASSRRSPGLWSHPGGRRGPEQTPLKGQRSSWGPRRRALAFQWGPSALGWTRGPPGAAQQCLGRGGWRCDLLGAQSCPPHVDAPPSRVPPSGLCWWPRRRLPPSVRGSGWAPGPGLHLRGGLQGAHPHPPRPAPDPAARRLLEAQTKMLLPPQTRISCLPSCSGRVGGGYLASATT